MNVVEAFALFGAAAAGLSSGLALGLRLRCGSGINLATLTKAVSREIHVDEAHGFPPAWEAHDLAIRLLIAYRDAAR